MAGLPPAVKPEDFNAWVLSNKADPNNPADVAEAIEVSRELHPEWWGEVPGSGKKPQSLMDQGANVIRAGRDVATQVVGSLLGSSGPPGMEGRRGPSAQPMGSPESQVGEARAVQGAQQAVGEAVVPQNATELALLAASAGTGAPLKAGASLVKNVAGNVARNVPKLVGIGGAAGAGEAAVLGQDPVQGGIQGGKQGFLQSVGQEAFRLGGRLLGRSPTPPASVYPNALAKAEAQAEQDWPKLVAAAAKDSPTVAQFLRRQGDITTVLDAKTGAQAAASKVKDHEERLIRDYLKGITLDIPSLGSARGSTTGLSFEAVVNKIRDLRRPNAKPSMLEKANQAEYELYQELGKHSNPRGSKWGDPNPGTAADFWSQSQQDYARASEWVRLLEDVKKTAATSSTKGHMVTPDNVAKALTDNIGKSGTERLPGAGSGAWDFAWEGATPGSREQLVTTIAKNEGVRNTLTKGLQAMSHAPVTRMGRGLASLLAAATKKAEQEEVLKIGMAAQRQAEREFTRDATKKARYTRENILTGLGGGLFQ